MLRKQSNENLEYKNKDKLLSNIEKVNIYKLDVKPNGDLYPKIYDGFGRMGIRSL